MIRILKLDPSPKENDTLSGSFLLESLDKTSEFEALSYVCGQRKAKEPFRIHDGDLEIWANLDAALRRLRLPDKPRLIWADAICIHQQHNPEKDRQVQMMADIYRKAKRTIAWFGQGDEPARTALRKLSTIADSAPTLGYHSPAEATGFIQIEYVGSKADLQSMKGNPRDVISMANEAKVDLIYNNPWFTRVWITQEAVLSSNLVVYVGSEEIDWVVLEVAISLLYRAICKIGRVPGAEVVGDIVGLFKERQHQFLYRAPPRADTVPGSLLGFDPSTMIQRLEMLLERSIPGPGQPPPAIMMDRPQRYLDTIWNLRYRSCGDDRDRVYALISLIPYDVPVRVEVKYERSAVEVYTAFTRELLNRNVIKVLLLAGIWDRMNSQPIHDLDEAPSWVCDFRLEKLKRGATRPWDHPLEQDRDIEQFEGPIIGFETNPLSRRLHIGLWLLDKIEDVQVSPIEIGSDPQMHCQTLYSRLEIFTKAGNLPSHALPSHKEMVTFAQVLGIKIEEYPGAVTRLAQLIIRGRQLTGAQPEWHIGEHFTNAVSDEDEKELESMIGRLSLCGAFFSTKRGWIGTGPSIISSKDEVVRIRGLLTPCILRKVEGQDDYWLVGGCYVHDEFDLNNSTMVWLV